MKKSIGSFVLAASLLLNLLCVSAEKTESVGNKVTMYVSTTGNDSNDGSFEKPLKTIDEAKSRARAIDKKHSKVDIIIRGGEYRHSNALVFNEKDSGTVENPVTYKAYEGEDVIIKMSRQLDISKAEMVTDPNILERLQETVKDNVIVLDLREQGIEQSMLYKPEGIDGLYGLDPNGAYENNTLFFNNDEQAVARYPNDRLYDRWDQTISPTKFTVYDTAPIDRWKDAKYAWLGIWPQYDYTYYRVNVTEFNAKERSITIKDNPAIEIQGFFTRRWSIFNLLEELDIPGEYYIDYDNLKLYLFPPDTIKGAQLEIVLSPDPIAKINNTKNIVFDGISFTQVRSNAVTLKDIDNVDFLNCKFKDVGLVALASNGSQQAITSGSTWQKQEKNGSYNMDVKNCDFYNIGGMAVAMYGAGDVDTLTPSNNTIENCVFERTSQRYMWTAVELAGCGITARNNTFMNITTHGLDGRGNDHVIEYNEFVDVNRESDDAAVIYCGRNILHRGWNINYNFIHNCRSIEPMVYNAVLGIYFDDGHEGHICNNNIIYDLANGFNSNYAAAFDFKYNTIVKTDHVGISLVGNPVRENKYVTSWPLYDTTELVLADIYDKELYFSRYPDLKTTMTTGLNPKMLTEVTDNLLVDVAKNSISEQDLKYSNIENNQMLTGTDMFVDAENLDFRLKRDSEAAKNNPNLLNEDNFNMDMIGVQRELVYNSETAPFNKTYPINGEKAVPADEVKFAWDYAEGATRYRLIIAEDSEFKNVVKDEIVYNTSTICELEKGKVYYWNVYAINNLRKSKNEWESTGDAYMFRTAIYDSSELEGLSNELVEAKDAVDFIVESEKAGEYKFGFKDMVNKYVQTIDFVLKAAPQTLTKTKIGFYKEAIKKMLQNKENINEGFLDLGKYMTQEYIFGEGVVKENESITLESTRSDHLTYVGTKGLDITTGEVIYCFDVQIDPLKNTYMMMGQNKSINMWGFNAKNIGYMLCIKNDMIELQRMDGMNGVIVDTKEISICDGKRHSIKYGKYNYGFINVFYTEIDGEKIFTYAETGSTNLVDDGEWYVQFWAPGDKITVLPSENIPGKEEFENLKGEVLKDVSRLLRDRYSDRYENISIMNLESLRLLVADGVYEIDAKPVATNDGNDAYITLKTAEILLGSTVSRNGTNARFNYNGKEITSEISNINGFECVKLSTISRGAGKSWYVDLDYAENILVYDAGGEQMQNMADRVKKTKGLMIMLNDYPGFKFDAE